MPHTPARPHLALLGSALALAALLAGCPSTTSTSDAAVAPDAFVELADAPAPTVDAPSCDLSPVPSPLPMIAGTFVVEGPDNMPPVVMPSGDPVGTWIFDRARFFVSETAGMNFDAAMSRVDGTSWLAFDGTAVRLSMELTLFLADTIGGDITRESLTHIRGSYELTGSDVTFTPSCVEGSMTSGSMPPTLGFAVEGDAGTLVIQSNGMLGRVTIVLEGMRQT
jgi:hypothetical protein